MDELHSLEVEEVPQCEQAYYKDDSEYTPPSQTVGFSLNIKEMHSHPFVDMQTVLDQMIVQNIFYVKVIKRFLDILFSSLAILFILSWIVPLFAIFIKFDSKGPLFFLQKRKGFHGKVFTCIKFRSMCPNTQSDMEPVREDDTRITRFGKLMRRYHLDELPQFFNVLKGNMTVVGPRPHMIHEDSFYEKIISNYAFRFQVKPGITGLGQVNNRVRITGRKKMEYRVFWDILYIKNWSQYLDIWIMCKTFSICLRGGKLR